MPDVLPQMPAETVVVVGSSSASLVSDVVEIAVGLHASAASTAEAIAQVSEVSSRVFAAATHGITEKNWHTERIDTTPTMDRDGTITGYGVAHALRLRLGSVTEAPTVLGALAEAAGDALRLSNLTLSAPDAGETRQRLAAEAVADAQTRAQRLAEAAGRRLGPVTSIVEQPAGQVHGRPGFATALGWRDSRPGRCRCAPAPSR